MNQTASQDRQNHPADPFAIPLRAVCIGCGCDDFFACLHEDGQPCKWLRVDYDAGQGVCSCCSELVPIWDEGGKPVGGGETTSRSPSVLESAP